MNTKIIINLSLAAATFGMLACNSAPQEEARMEKQVDAALEDLRQAKDDAAKELRDLREKLAIHLDEVEAKLEEPKLTVKQREDQEAKRVEIKDQIQRLDDGLDQVERSTNETWKDVKEAVRKTTDDAGNWFERQAEKIDRKTDADRDKDGH